MTEDVVRTLGYLGLGTRLRRIGERLQAEAQRIIDDEGLDIQASQFPYIFAIDRQEPVAVGELAERLGVSQPGVTRTVSQLADIGLVVLEQAPDDQRRRNVRLTEKGRELLHAATTRVCPRIEQAVMDVCGALEGPLLEQLEAIEDELSRTPLIARRRGESRAGETP